MVEIDKIDNVKENIELEANITEYLISKGKIRACLLFKLLKRFCSAKSTFKVRKSELISQLVSMLKSRKLEIIIAEPFDVDWELTQINDFNFLKKGEYLTRTFRKWPESDVGVIPRMDYL